MSFKEKDEAMTNWPNRKYVDFLYKEIKTDRTARNSRLPGVELADRHEDESLPEILDIPRFIETVDLKNLSVFSTHIMEDPVRIKITYMITNCTNTNWVIPNFQRYFAWNKEDIRSFLTSIFKDYYVGAFLLWKAGGEPEVETQEIKGVVKRDGLKSDSVILDGQQRITSLYYAISAPNVKSFLDKSNWRDTTIYRDHPLYFYVDFGTYLRDPKSVDIIRISSNKLSMEDSFQTLWFPFYELEKYDDWVSGLEKFLRRQSSSALYDKIYDTKEIVRKRLSHIWTEYEIPYIQLPKSMGIDQVTDIFEQLNTKGKPLSV
jgi:uncharacterized protein with ParB-like and HNH nuclease domain